MFVTPVMTASHVVNSFYSNDYCKLLYVTRERILLNSTFHLESDATTLAAANRDMFRNLMVLFRALPGVYLMALLVRSINSIFDLESMKVNFICDGRILMSS